MTMASVLPPRPGPIMTTKNLNPQGDCLDFILLGIIMEMHLSSASNLIVSFAGHNLDQFQGLFEGNLLPDWEALGLVVFAPF